MLPLAPPPHPDQEGDSAFCERSTIPVPSDAHSADFLLLARDRTTTMVITITLVKNSQQNKQCLVQIEEPVSLESLRVLARNKMKMKACRFYADGGALLIDGTVLKQGDRVLASAREAYVGTIYSEPQPSAAAPASPPSPAEPRPCTVTVPANNSAASSDAVLFDEIERVLLPGEKGEIAWLRVGAGRLALWHKPGKKSCAKLRQVAGATAVVTLLAEREGAEAIGMYAERAGLEWMWHALDGADADYLATDAAVAMLIDATVATTRALRSGASVLVHCSAGVHRTGTIGYAALRVSGLSAAAAISALGAMRAATGDGVDHAGPGRAGGSGRTALAERCVVAAALHALAVEVDQSGPGVVDGHGGGGSDAARSSEDEDVHSSTASEHA